MEIYLVSLLPPSVPKSPIPYTLFAGKAPQTQQDSFQYKMEFGVKSVMLDDDTCDCYSTLNMGHGICFLAGARFNEYVFGVDLLYHENDCGTVASTVPVPTNGLSIFFKGK